MFGCFALCSAGAAWGDSWDSDSGKEGIQSYGLGAKWRALGAREPLVQLLPGGHPWCVPHRLSPFPGLVSPIPPSNAPETRAQAISPSPDPRGGLLAGWAVVVAGQWPLLPPLWLDARGVRGNP